MHRSRKAELTTAKVRLKMIGWRDHEFMRQGRDKKGKWTSEQQRVVKSVRIWDWALQGMPWAQGKSASFRTIMHRIHEEVMYRRKRWKEKSYLESAIKVSKNARGPHICVFTDGTVVVQIGGEGWNWSQAALIGKARIFNGLEPLPLPKSY